ncbi:MAG: TrmH family RNA methyltransferase [Flavobacteriales bacterium]
MISKQKIKDVAALQQKKFRKQEGLFVAEGRKLIHAIVDSTLTTLEVFYTSDYPAPDLLHLKQKGIHCELVTEKEMERISGFATPSDVLAVCAIPSEKEFKSESKIILVLDGIRDPGNLGTLIRLAAWFGIDFIICSDDTAEFTNPKCVQATMGAFTAVNIIYKNLPEFLSLSSASIYVASMEGESIYSLQPDFPCFIVIGSESHGVSDEVVKLCKNKISIPYSGHTELAPESLNAAMAASIICSEFTRKIHYA